MLCTSPMTELFPTSCKIYSLDGSEMKPSQSPQLGFSEPAVKQILAKGGVEKRIGPQEAQRISPCEHLMGTDVFYPYLKWFWGSWHRGCGHQILLYLSLLCLCSCEWCVIVAEICSGNPVVKTSLAKDAQDSSRRQRGKEEKQHTYSCR